MPSAPAKRVYVQNFTLDAEATEPRHGALRPAAHLPAADRRGSGGARATRRRRDRDATLVKDLDAAGIPAERLLPGQPLPPEGWLIRGVFTEADSGNTLRRAVIGFGSGKTDMEVQVGVGDLANRPEESFLLFGTVTDPSRLPGGVVSRNPYVVAAKFVLEKGAPQRDVEHTAQTIAAELVKFRDQVQRGQVTLPAR